MVGKGGVLICLGRRVLKSSGLLNRPRSILISGSAAGQESSSIRLCEDTVWLSPAQVRLVAGGNVAAAFVVICHEMGCCVMLLAASGILRTPDWTLRCT